MGYGLEISVARSREAFWTKAISGRGLELGGFEGVPRLCMQQPVCDRILSRAKSFLLVHPISI